MLVRHSFVHLSALDAQQQAADTAVGSLSQVQASIAREQVFAGHLASAPDKNLYEQLQAEAQVTDQRMTLAAQVLSPSGKFAALQPLQQRHAAIIEHLRASEHSPDRRAWPARCRATSDEEHAVSTDTAGPSKPKA